MCGIKYLSKTVLKMQGGGRVFADTTVLKIVTCNVHAAVHISHGC